MEKLLELLIEYIRQKFEFGEYGVYINKQNKLILEKQHSFMGYGIDEEWYQDVEFGESIIISKQFEFIKWLLENGKIETNNLSLQAFKNIFGGGGFVEVSDLEALLMLLSISDTPIEDLISYLK